MKKLISAITLITLFVLITLPRILQAQPGLPGDPSQAPIDGGLLWLLLGGGAYGIKKLRDRGKEQ